MKKILMYFLSTVLVLTLASCGSTTSKTTSTASNSASSQNSETTPVKKHVLKYLSWGFGTEEENNLTRRMVEAYNAQSTTTRVEMMVPDAGMAYNEFITTMASGNNMPDVFLVTSVPNAVISHWALDLADLTAADSEWNDVEVALRDSITYGSHVYAVPSAQNYVGLFANYDLINDYMTTSEDAATAFAPGAFTTDDWMNMVKAMNDCDVEDGTGVIGTDSVSDAINWMPSALDPTNSIKHFLFDGTKFDYKSDLALNALKKIQELSDKNSQYVLNSIPDTDGDAENPVEIKAKKFGTTDATAIFNNGQMGFRQDGSWAVMPDDIDFDYKFIGFPNSKVISAPDYSCISKNTEYPQEAYDFLKFMTFGSAGIQKRFDIIDNNKDANLSVAGLPITTNKTLYEKWFNYVDINGLKEVYDKVADGSMQVLVEGHKSIPGFESARFTFSTGISIPGVRDGAPLTIGDFLWDVCSGDITINQYTTNMTDDLANRLNKEVDNAYISMGLTRN